MLFKLDIGRAKLLSPPPTAILIEEQAVISDRSSSLAQSHLYRSVSYALVPEYAFSTAPIKFNFFMGNSSLSVCLFEGGLHIWEIVWSPSVRKKPVNSG